MFPNEHRFFWYLLSEYGNELPENEVTGLVLK